MSGLTVTIKDNKTGEIVKEIQCSAIIGGYADSSGKTTGGFGYSKNALGLDIVLTIIETEKAIDETKKDEMVKLAYDFMKKGRADDDRE